MKFSLRACCGELFGLTFVYSTPKILHVRSCGIGLANRLIQISVFAYVIGYAIIYKKGYQDTDIVQSSVTAKVKGVASTMDDLNLPPEYRRVWDTPEFVPTIENGAFVVLTNAIITSDQRLGTCAEDPWIKPCDPLRASESCIAGAAVENGNGVMTGRCIQTSGADNKTHSCEIRAWCPIERRKLLLNDRPLLPQATNFTVFIKNNVEFPKFGIKLSNIRHELNNERYLRTCRNSPHTSKYCPVFRLGDIVDRADRRKGKNAFNDIATLGGVIDIAIKWDCDFDRDPEKCLPVYEFTRLDSPPVPISLGYNFRFAKYFHHPGRTESRDLIKAYGILFIITVEGQAGKFSIIPLAFNIGAGIGLFGLAIVITDFILLYISRHRTRYQEEKFTVMVGKRYDRIKKRITKKAKDTNPPNDDIKKDKTDALFDSAGANKTTIDVVSEQNENNAL